MKRIYAAIIAAFLFYGCSHPGLSSKSWKDNYKLQPETGVLVGKIELAHPSSDHFDFDSMVVVLSDQFSMKVYAYDIITRKDNYVIFKNIREGSYYLYSIYELLKYNTIDISDEYVKKPVSYMSFVENECWSGKIEIKKDSIVYMELTTPGKEINRVTPMPQIYIDSWQAKLALEEKKRDTSHVFQDTCKPKMKILALNQNNYQYYDSLKNLRVK